MVTDLRVKEDSNKCEEKHADSSTECSLVDIAFFEVK